MLTGAAALALAACSHEDVRSGYIGPASMTQDQVVQMLNQQGYTDIDGLHKNGQHWVGAAEKDGHQVTFDIGADGKIRTR
jgi:hypothetical protein